MKRLAALIWFALICSAHAQSVQQSGVVTPTHFACWTTGGVIQDCGVAAAPFASTGGVQPGPFCVNSGPQTGPYQSFCLNTSPTTGGILSIQNFGGAPTGGISFNINGSPAGLPVVVLPTINGDAACFNNTTGTLVDCGVPNFKPNIDIFLVIGASNDVGQGNSAQSPVPPANMALMYCANGTVVAVTDPTCSAISVADNANTGSIWPAFAIAYGRRVGLVITAISGATQASACDFHSGGGNWQDTTAGSNYANALAAINAALTAYTAAGYTPIFRGIISTSLGGNDAVQINASVCTSTQYSTAYTAMAANWRAATIGGTTYPQMPIYLAQTGTILAAADNPGFPQIRSAQLTLAAADGNLLLLNIGLPSFGERGLLASGQHYTAVGYNQVGTLVGGLVLPFIQTNLSFQSWNANVSAPPVPAAGTILQITGKDATAGYVELNGFGAVNSYMIRHAAGTAVAPTATQSATLMGVYGFRGYGATGYATATSGGFGCLATENWTDTAHGTQCGIYTTINGTAAAVQSLLVSPAGTALGGTDVAAPIAQTLSVQNVLTGTSNTAGANFTLAGSRGTGTGVGGAIFLQTAPAGSTGSTQNPLVNAVVILGNGNIGFGTETNPQFSFVVSSNPTTGVTFSGMPNGAWMIGSAGTIVGWQTLAVAQFGNITTDRIDNTLASPSNLGSAEVIGGFNFGGFGAGALQSGRAQIVVTTLEAWTTTFGTGLQFNTTAAGAARAQAMYIKGGVIIGSGTTDPGVNNLLVGGTIAATLANTATTSAVCYNTGTGLFTYDATLGTCNTSDERLKKFDGPVLNALASLVALSRDPHFGYFDWSDPRYGTGRHIGIGAQTVARFFPELTATGSDGFMSLAYDKLTVPIIAAIVQLKTDNDNLHHEITELKRMVR